MLLKYSPCRQKGHSWIEDVLKRDAEHSHTTSMVSSLTPSLEPLNHDFSPSHITVSYSFDLNLAMDYNQLLWLGQPTAIK